MFCAAILLGRLSSSFADPFLIWKSFSSSKLSETSKGTKCCIGLFIIQVFFVFGWNTTNSAPKTFPSLLSKNLFIFPLHRNSLGLSFLIITISPIRNFTWLLNSWSKFVTHVVLTTLTYIPYINDWKNVAKLSPYASLVHVDIHLLLCH